MDSIDLDNLDNLNTYFEDIDIQSFTFTLFKPKDQTIFLLGIKVHYYGNKCPVNIYDIGLLIDSNCDFLIIEGLCYKISIRTDTTLLLSLV